MNRQSRVAFFITITLGALALVVPAPARADPIGGVIVIPGTGTDLTAMRLRTSAGCPAQATAFYAKMRGHGFPPDGQVTTANTSAGMSHTIGFDVYVALIMRTTPHGTTPRWAVATTSRCTAWIASLCTATGSSPGRWGSRARRLTRRSVRRRSLGRPQRRGR